MRFTTSSAMIANSTFARQIPSASIFVPVTLVRCSPPPNKKRAASACYRGDPWITLVSENRRVTRPAICCERNRFNRRTSLAAYSPVNLRTVSRPVPEPTRHGHHPSTAGTPSSRGACASDEPRANARNGVRREIHEIGDALKAFKIAVEAREMTGFKVQRLPAASKI